MKLLAVDPGEKVGWARVDVAEDGTWNDLRHGITELWPMADKILKVAGDYDLILYEEWRLYPDKAKTMVGSTFPSVQFIGATKLAARSAGTPVIGQGARLIQEQLDKAMRVLMPDMWKLCTRPIAHDDGHDQDAIRHLFYWTVKNTDLVKGVPNG